MKTVFDIIEKKRHSLVHHEPTFLLPGKLRSLSVIGQKVGEDLDLQIFLVSDHGHGMAKTIYTIRDLDEEIPLPKIHRVTDVLVFAASTSGPFMIELQVDYLRKTKLQTLCRKILYAGWIDP